MVSKARLLKIAKRHELTAKYASFPCALISVVGIAMNLSNKNEFFFFTAVLVLNTLAYWFNLFMHKQYLAIAELINE